MSGSEAPALADRRIVVTGGLGFVGSNLVHRLAETNEVTVLDCLAGDTGANPHNLDGTPRPANVLRVDLSEASTYRDPKVCAALDDADVVFHCAARTSHPVSMRDPIGDLRNNAEATLRLLEALRQRGGDTRFVLPATTSQTGAMQGEAISEDDPERPRDVYSAHKSVQEKYALVYAQAHGLDAVSVRLSNVYGPRAAIHSPALGFVNHFIGLALQDAEITVFGDGRQRRGILHVDDAVAALLAAAWRPGVRGEVFQASQPEAIALRDLAATIVATIGGRVRHVPYPEARKGTEIGDVSYSIAKIQDRLGWTPRIDLRSGLQSTAAYYRPRLADYLVMA